MGGQVGHFVGDLIGLRVFPPFLPQSACWHGRGLVLHTPSRTELSAYLVLGVSRGELRGLGEGILFPCWP